MPRDKSDAVIAAYNFLETFLEKADYLTGSHMTVADLSAIATVTSLNVFVPIASNRFPNITQWMQRMQSLPYYNETNQKGLDIFTSVMKSKMS